MMHGPEKSDPAIRARKPVNKAGRPAAEQVEQRAGAEGNAGQPHTCRAQDRGSVSPGLDRVRQAARFAVTHPRWEPGARIAPAGICAGGIR